MPELAEWVTKQCGLLDLELEEENSQLATKIQSLSAIQCQDAGLSLLHLEIDSMRTSMFGRSTITLTSDKGKDAAILQNSTFKVGDEVVLYNPKNRHTADAQESQVNGVISKVTKCTLEIVCEDTPNEELMTPPLRMDMRSNEYTHRKMVTTLKELETSSHRLVRILIACDQVSRFEISHKAFELVSFKLFNPNLNESQISAVKCSLQAPLVSIIHGPPGTGKTATVTELILQAVARGQKVLVCAPSNVAVDNVLERVVRAATSPQWDRRTERPRVVRLGHPARVSPYTLPHCLDARIMSDEGTEIVNDVRAEMDKLRRAMCGPGRRRDKAKQREQRAEMRELRREVRTREEKVVASVLGSSNVVLCTCVGAGSRVLRDVAFDLVVVDEAAQALEAACWVPILRGHRLVLAGDHLQLPPTVKSAAAEKGGLSRTLFERIIRDEERFGDVTRLLDTQYRMNSLISDWASAAMYEGKLQSDPSVANHSLEGFLPRSANTLLSTPETKSPSSDESSEGVAMREGGGDDAADADKQRKPDQEVAEISTQEDVDATTAATTHIPVLLLLDTADCGMEESEPEAANPSSRASHRNAQEAEVVLRHVRALVAAGVRPNQIGVITPYNGQLEVLKQLLLGGTTPPKEVAKPNDNQSADHKGGKKAEDGQGPRDNKGGKASKHDDDDYDRDVSPLDGVEIRTVDGFQGGEKECIVMSLVRSNRHREVGFLGDHRRINVGVTRARRHLCVVCDTNTCASDPFIRSLLEHMSRRGDHRSAEEYMAADEATIFSVFDTPAGGTAVMDEGINTEGDAASTSGDGATSEMTSSLLKFGGGLSSRLSKGKNPQSVGEQRRSAPGKAAPSGVPSGSKPKPTPKPTTEAEAAAGTAAEGAQVSRTGDALDPEIEVIITDFARGDIGAGTVRLVNQHLVAPQSSLHPSAAAPAPAQPNGGKKILRFPSQLNSYSRMRVHSLAEELGLSHRSCGEGLGRFVEVSNAPFASASAVTEDGSSVTSVRATPNPVRVPSLTSSGSESARVDKDDPNGNSSANSVPHAESEVNMPEQHKEIETQLQDEVCLGEMSQLQLALAQSDDDDDDDDVNERQEKSGPIVSGAGGAKKLKSKKKKTKSGASSTLGSNSSAQAYSDLKAKPVQYYIGEGRAKAMAAANEKLKSLDSQVFDDEDAALQAAMDANKAITQLHKYRVGASEMPNWEKEQAKARLHQKIEAARHKSDSESKKSVPEDSSEGANAKSSKSHKKVVKKPPPNFGGGKLGSS